MDINQINQCLAIGNFSLEGVLPHLDELKLMPYQFTADFGLDILPEEPGIIMIRGPRQYGKSTWLEQQIANTIKTFGPSTAFYLNGDEIIDSHFLMEKIRDLISLFSKNSSVRRIFIDEITAIAHWEKAIKRLADAGELKEILVVTTGSKATDLRRGFERLPGRKGKLARTNYIFTPVSYSEFIKKCGTKFNEDALFAYILSGGSPIGINELAKQNRLPEFISAIVTDWIYGEFAATGRSRAHLLAVFHSIFKMAGSPIGQAKLARESGLANNTVAQGYIELLTDLMIVQPAYAYDIEKKIILFRKQSKYIFSNLLAAICLHPKQPKTIQELKNLDADLGPIFEWLVAQEIWRRRCINNNRDLLDHFLYWQSKEHEIDFILPECNQLIEVKKGVASAFDFLWFPKIFPKNELLVINQTNFSSAKVQGIKIEEFLCS